MKKEYMAPGLEDLGSIREMTLGQAAGTASDAVFPINTPISEFTFTNI